MFETMYNSKGVGLAAPQIGKSIRLFIVDASPFEEDEPDLKDFVQVFINPVIIEESGKDWDFSEGCLSIPSIREDVNRKERLIIQYQDENFETWEEEFDGIAARIIQHEYDHIEGKLFVERLNPLRRRMLKNRLLEISKGNVDVEYKMKFYVK
jgi:peptide deformylase